MSCFKILTLLALSIIFSSQLCAKTKAEKTHQKETVILETQKTPLLTGSSKKATEDKNANKLAKVLISGLAIGGIGITAYLAKLWYEINKKGQQNLNLKLLLIDEEERRVDIINEQNEDRLGLEEEIHKSLLEQEEAERIKLLLDGAATLTQEKILEVINIAEQPTERKELLSSTRSLLTGSNPLLADPTEISSEFDTELVNTANQVISSRAVDKIRVDPYWLISAFTGDLRYISLRVTHEYGRYSLLIIGRVLYILTEGFDQEKINKFKVLIKNQERNRILGEIESLQSAPQCKEYLLWLELLKENIKYKDNSYKVAFINKEVKAGSNVKYYADFYEWSFK